MNHGFIYDWGWRITYVGLTLIVILAVIFGAWYFLVKGRQ